MTQDDLQKLRTELKNDVALLRSEIRELKTEFKNNISLIKIETQELETNLILKVSGVLLIAVIVTSVGLSAYAGVLTAFACRNALRIASGKSSWRASID